MTHREQLAILALLIVLLLVFALFPRSAASDAPVVASAVPQSLFEPVGSAGSLSGLSTPGAPFQPRTLPVVGSPPILEKPAPSPSVRAVPSVAPVRPRAAASPNVTTVGLPEPVTGTASWFRSPVGVSAAGPSLRRALGPGWRGTRVRVAGPAGSAVTTLGDWMRADRLIDLDDDVFPAVCGPLSRGICRVEVTP
jgi:hypothetical protein